MAEDVLHQRHYMQLEIQPIMIMLKDLSPAEFMGFLKGNVIKYVLRANLKNGLEDLAKARQYAAWMEEFARTGSIRLAGITDRGDMAREWHHYYSDSGSNESVSAALFVEMLEGMFPELAPKEAHR